MVLKEYPEIYGFECEFNQEMYHDDLYKKADIEFPANLHQAVTKRKSEFFAGRYSCLRVLKLLQAQSKFVGVGSHREPLWPEGFTGSISHCCGSALAVISDKRQIISVGVDRENWFDEKVAKQVYDIVLSSTEKERLNTVPLQFNTALTIVFSAKESAFKALHPLIRRFFGFDAVSVEFIAIENNKGAFRIQLDASLLRNCPCSNILTGTFSIRKDYVTTLISLSN